MAAPPPYAPCAIESNRHKDKIRRHCPTRTSATLELPFCRHSDTGSTCCEWVPQLLLRMSRDLTICTHKSPSDEDSLKKPFKRASGGYASDTREPTSMRAIRPGLPPAKLAPHQPGSPGRVIRARLCCISKENGTRMCKLDMRTPCNGPRNLWRYCGNPPPPPPYAPCATATALGLRSESHPRTNTITTADRYG